MQIEAVATFKGWKLRLMGALFIIKVKILVLVNWSYSSTLIMLTIEFRTLIIFWEHIVQESNKHINFW